MNPPKNYAEWMNYFDLIEKWEIAHTDIEAMEALELGTISWTSGTAERFVNSLLILINARLTKLNNFFSGRMMRTNDKYGISSLLITYRKELIFLKKLACLKVLPKENSQVLCGQILDCAKKAQQSLEESAKKDLTGELKRIISGNRIDNI